MLSDLLYSLKETEFFFNLFGYISFRSGLSLVTSFFIVIILMPHWIRFQKSIFPSGQPIRNDGPDTHYHKKGTPTMGGVFIIFGTYSGYILSHINFWTIGAGFKVEFIDINPVILISLSLGTLMACVGLIDDLLKVRKNRNLGLRARNKIFLHFKRK